MKKILILVLVSLLFSDILKSQVGEFDFGDDDEKKKKEFAFKDKLLVGGSFGLQVGTIISIEISPEISFRFHEKLHIGIGGTYTYYKNFTYNIQSSIYGGKLFARGFMTEKLFVQGEYELLNVPETDFMQGGYTGERIFVPGMLAGIGYKQDFGKYASAMTCLLYNFTMTEQTPYYNPIFRIGFLISLESRNK